LDGLRPPSLLAGNEVVIEELLVGPEISVLAFSDGYTIADLLFTGFMLSESGPKMLEYNVRFGDPEMEALMLLLSEDTDLAAVILVRTFSHSTPVMTARLPSCIGLR
jgi:phosphoribosylamine-glycine ligase